MVEAEKQISTQLRNFHAEAFPKKKHADLKPFQAYFPVMRSYCLELSNSKQKATRQVPMILREERSRIAPQRAALIQRDSQSQAQVNGLDKSQRGSF